MDPSLLFFLDRTDNLNATQPTRRAADIPDVLVQVVHAYVQLHRLQNALQHADMASWQKPTLILATASLFLFSLVVEEPICFPRTIFGLARTVSRHHYVHMHLQL